MAEANVNSFWKNILRLQSPGIPTDKGLRDADMEETEDQPQIQAELPRERRYRKWEEPILEE